MPRDVNQGIVNYGRIGGDAINTHTVDQRTVGRHLAMERPPRASAAQEASQVRLFVSHAHLDADIAERLVGALELAAHVPDGAIRCTSVPGYQLDLGAMAPDVLRRELAAAECVVAILTPNGLLSPWVLFELGATWAQAKTVLPLLGGPLSGKDLPGPLQGASGGRLDDQAALAQFLHQTIGSLNWRPRNLLAASAKLGQLVSYLAGKPFFETDVDRELRATLAAKRTRLGANQGKILDYITAAARDRAWIPQRELESRFRDLPAGVFYRLEQLRYLGFLVRQPSEALVDAPELGWTISRPYRSEIGPY